MGVDDRDLGQLPVGRSLSHELPYQADAADLQIETFISRRDAQRRRGDLDHEEEASWEETSEIHRLAHEARMREAWSNYHHEAADRLRANLVALIAHHEEQAARYEPPEGAA